MKISIRKGLGFGLTSGIITTLGLIIGLNAGTGSRVVVIAGIITIAIADSFSDAMGMHISEESGHKQTNKKEIWESTLATFFSKFIFALSFIIPFLLFDLNTAIIISLIWGISLITLFSYYIAKIQDAPPHKAIFEHLLITFLVIIATYFTGYWISIILA